MDILSHGLWATVGSQVVDLKRKRKLNTWAAFFWGLFPDLFAFGPSFVWIAIGMMSGQFSLNDLPRPPHELEPVPDSRIAMLQLSSQLYNYSHSLIIFGVVFGLVYLIRKRPVWEMLGWLLHILMDIPTHSYQFFPTPFLWPISGIKYNGISWGQPWFLISDYSLMLISFLIIRYLKQPRPRP